MAKKQIKKSAELPPIEINITEEEAIYQLELLKQIGKFAEGEDVDFSKGSKVKRKQKSLIEKLTGLEALEELFINEQLGRRNSPYTIKHYQRTFKKLFEFLSYQTAESQEALSEIYDYYAEDRDNALYLNGKQLPIATLEMDDIQKKFGDYLTDVDMVNEQTVLSYFRDFRAIMYYAMDNGWIERFKIVIPEREAPIKNCYTKLEIDKLLKKPDENDFTEYRDWVIINYLLSTGHRIQTIINLKVGDIDFDEGYINVNTQKNRSVSRVGLIRKMQVILKEYITYYRCDEDGNPLYDEVLFCNRYGEPLTDGGLKMSIKSYNERRGVSKTSIHLFRHTFAKNWIVSGGDIVSLQKMLGHSSLKMVQRYANLYASDVKEKAEDFSLLAQTRTKSGKTIQKRQPLQIRK